MGAMQSEYEGPAEAWKHLVEKLSQDGYDITEQSSQDTDSKFFHINNDKKHFRDVWIIVDNCRPDGDIKIELHWLTRTSDQDSDWMLVLAKKINHYLLEKGMVCVFGSPEPADR